MATGRVLLMKGRIGLSRTTMAPSTTKVIGKARAGTSPTIIAGIVANSGMSVAIQAATIAGTIAADAADRE